ncbi:MAG: hypothetical protein H6811_01650 [Phycisphaeraceae bacterium]|nr:hypothetical protein [Phycisphaeraceae bacterium]
MIRRVLARLAAEALAPLASLWVWRRGRRACARGAPIEGSERIALSSHVSAGLLDRVRVERAPVGMRLGRGVLRALGADVATPGAITLGRAVIIGRDVECTASLMLHELVHVAQYARLGGYGFLRRYLREWLMSGYMGISLERDAYELQAWFERGRPFDVEDEVDGRLRVEG